MGASRSFQVKLEVLGYPQHIFLYSAFCMSSSPTITTATMNSFRLLPRAATRALRSTSLLSKSSFSTSPRLLNASSTRKPPEAPDAEAAALRKGNAPYRRIDVRDVEQLNAIVEEIASKHQRLDGLIAAAGIQQETPALDYTAKDADLMMGINVTGCFMTAQAAARQMIKYGNGGSIVMIASMSGTVANRGLICPAYNASKAAVIQLARNLAMEWGEHGIRVNTISPGYIVTAMVEALFEKYPERKESWPTQNMLGRLSYPEEYRGAAAFLISDASSFMTGSDLRMDGGHSAW